MGEQAEAFPVSRKRISRSQRPSSTPLDLSTMHQDDGSGFFWMDRRRCRIYSFDDVGRHHIFDACDVPFFRNRFHNRQGPSRFGIFLQPGHGFRHRTDRGRSGGEARTSRRGRRRPLLVGSGTAWCSIGRVLCGARILVWTGNWRWQRLNIRPTARPDSAMVLSASGACVRHCDRGGQRRNADVSNSLRKRSGHIWLKIPLFWFRRYLSFDWPSRRLRSGCGSEEPGAAPRRSFGGVDAARERDDNLRAQPQRGSSRQAILFALFL